jgi:hypothetical protein
MTPEQRARLRAAGAQRGRAARRARGLPRGIQSVELRRRVAALLARPLDREQQS